MLFKSMSNLLIVCFNFLYDHLEHHYLFAKYYYLFYSDTFHIICVGGLAVIFTDTNHPLFNVGAC